MYWCPDSNPLEPCNTQEPSGSQIHWWWGCFSYHSVEGHVVLPMNTTMNQRNCLELLCNHLLWSFDMFHTTTFMQDSALCHITKLVKQWPKGSWMLFFEDWPAKSPDLNPTKTLGDHELELCSHNCSAGPKLQAALCHLWRSLTPQHLMALAEPSCAFRRVQEV